METVRCQRLLSKVQRLSTDSFSDIDIDGTLDVVQFVTVEVHQ